MAGRKRPRGEREGGENDDVEMSDVEDLPPPLSSRRRSHSPSRSPSQSFSTNRQGSATPGPDRRSATPQPDLDAAVKRYEGDFHQDDIDTMLQLTQQFGLTARMVDQIFKCLESLPQFSQERATPYHEICLYTTVTLCADFCAPRTGRMSLLSTAATAAAATPTTPEPELTEESIRAVVKVAFWSSDIQAYSSSSTQIADLAMNTLKAKPEKIGKNCGSLFSNPTSKKYQDLAKLVRVSIENLRSNTKKTLAKSINFRGDEREDAWNLLKTGQELWSQFKITPTGDKYHRLALMRYYAKTLEIEQLVDEEARTWKSNPQWWSAFDAKLASITKASQKDEAGRRDAIAKVHKIFQNDLTAQPCDLSGVDASLNEVDSTASTSASASADTFNL